jgi:hypothetical protein
MKVEELVEQSGLYVRKLLDMELSQLLVVMEEGSKVRLEVGALEAESLYSVITYINSISP